MCEECITLCENLALHERQRNAEGKIILVYDDDERAAHRAATTLVERGYDNLFMLSGGKSHRL